MSNRLLRTADLVRLLQEKDPSGELIVSFRVYDAYDDCFVAGGEIDEIHAITRGRPANKRGG
jgi:hypothetical protein